MAIDWKTIISEFDGKPTLLQAIGKLRKAVEDETITIQQAQAEIAKLETQQKADEALITTAQSAAQAADTKAQAAQSAAQAADTKAQNALNLAQTNKQDITSLEAEASIEVIITPASATSGTLTEEQYNTLITNDNCYIKLNEVVYTLSKNSATGVLIYSSKYLSDTKTMRTITVTKSTKAWVMAEVSVGGGGKLYRHLLSISIYVNTSSGEIGTLESDIKAEFFSSDNTPCSNYNDVKVRSKNKIFMQAFGSLVNSDYTKYYSVVGFENINIYFLNDNSISYSTYNDFTCTDEVIEC